MKQCSCLEWEIGPKIGNNEMSYSIITGQDLCPWCGSDLEDV